MRKNKVLKEMDLKLVRLKLLYSLEERDYFIVYKSNSKK